MNKLFIRRLPVRALLVLLLACEQPAPEKITDLPRSTPEAEGISSEAIHKFLESIDTSRHEFHSFMFLRHGKVVAEGWWNPYGPELKHTMYSTSKSFTSTAVGFAVQEKLLTVDDSVISFFPEALPDTVGDYLRQLTVKDLLTMSVGMDPDPTTTIPGDSLWVKSFFETPILFEPGSKFLYNSMATYMLSAIVTRVTGQKVIDYLTPRLFQPLSISGIDWETDPVGNNTGGWGLRLKTEDMAKFGQLLLQQGVWNGEQVLAKEWIEEATSFKIQQYPETTQEQKDASDWLQGYCYQFWRCRNNAFRADGAFGQYIIVMPEKDAVFAITSETPDMQGILDMIWSQLLPAMKEEALPQNEAAAGALQTRLAGLSLKVPAPGSSSMQLAGKTFDLQENDRNLDAISFDLSEGASSVAFRQAGNTYTIPVGAGQWAYSETSRKGPYLVGRARNALEGLPPFKVAAAYSWTAENVLELTFRYIESPHTEIITCTFEGDDIALDFKISFAPQLELPVLAGELVE